MGDVLTEFAMAPPALVISPEKKTVPPPTVVFKEQVRGSDVEYSIFDFREKGDTNAETAIYFDGFAQQA